MTVSLQTKPHHLKVLHALLPFCESPDKKKFQTSATLL